MRNAVRSFNILAVLVVVALLSTLLMAPGEAPAARAQGEAPTASPGGATSTYDIPKVVPYDFNGDVRDLPQMPATPPRMRPVLKGPANMKQANGTEAPVPASKSATAPAAPMPAPIQNFAGMNYSDACTGGPCGSGWPPDTNGDVGPNHYIQAVNDAYAIYNKTGTLLASFTENALWSGVGTTPCNGNANGDPIVLYDTISNRWVLTHLAFAFSGGVPVSPFYQCIAASKTADPVAGGWWLYAIRMDPGGAGFPPVNTLNDYPKFGLWTDCLYYSANGFLFPAGTFNGTEFGSFSRSDMYSGLPLTGALGFIANTTNPFTMIPSNLRGATASQLPPAGTPNYFVSESQLVYAYEVRKFTAGANCGGAGGSLSAATNVSQTSYTVPSGNYVPQPGTANTLDAIDDRLMQKVQYRKVGTAESLWVTHNVLQAGSTNVAMQWAQIDITGGTVATTPVQQGFHRPDTTLHRWMGSIAADNQGNVALGYSTSNGTAPNYPSIKYVGRLVGDPANTLPQTETQLVAGAGSQTNTCGGGACARWGDYSAMSVDPVDDCTFWYTNQYYSSQANGTAGNWQTRIGSFKFPNCTPLAVTLADFHAAEAGDAILVSWETVSEVTNQGFNLYRNTTSDPVGELLAYVPSQAPGSTQGFSYTFTDAGVQPGQTYWYWLEDVSLSGATTLHGPVSATVSVPTAVTLSRMAAGSSSMPVPLTGLALAVALLATTALAWRRKSHVS